MTRTHKPPPIVEVQWVDSFTKDGWQAHGTRNAETGECWSVGYLLKQDDEKIVLCGSWSVTEHMSETTIHRGAIVSMTELRK